MDERPLKFSEIVKIIDKGNLLFTLECNFDTELSNCWFKSTVSTVYSEIYPCSVQNTAEEELVGINFQKLFDWHCCDDLVSL